MFILTKNSFHCTKKDAIFGVFSLRCLCLQLRYTYIHHAKELIKHISVEILTREMKILRILKKNNILQ